MRAIVLREVGPIEALRLEDRARPAPRAGRGRSSALEAAALNHRDVWIRKGMYAGIRFPAILGSDGSGVVSEVGEGVDREWVGRSVILDPGLDWGDDPRVQGPKFRVLGMPDDGTYAEMIRLPASSVLDRPAHLTAQDAAALPLAGLTAYRALGDSGEARRGRDGADHRDRGRRLGVWAGDRQGAGCPRDRHVAERREAGAGRRARGRRRAWTPASRTGTRRRRSSPAGKGPTSCSTAWGVRRSPVPWPSSAGGAGSSRSARRRGRSRSWS